MNENTFYLIVFVVVALVSAYKFMQRANDSLYGTRNSFFCGEDEFDTTKLVFTIGVIGVLIWVQTGGLNSLLGLPAPVHSTYHSGGHYWGSSIGRSSSGFVMPSGLGRSRSFH